MSSRGEADGRRKIKLELKHKAPILERPRVTVSSGTNTRRVVTQGSTGPSKTKAEASPSVPTSFVAPNSVTEYPALASAVAVPVAAPARHDSKLAAAVAAAAEIVRRKRRYNKNAGTEPTLSRFSEAGIKPLREDEEEDNRPKLASTVTVVNKPELTQITRTIINNLATSETGSKSSPSSDKPPVKADSPEKTQKQSPGIEGEPIAPPAKKASPEREVAVESPKQKDKEERGRKRSVSGERSPKEKKTKSEKTGEVEKPSSSKTSAMRKDDSPERRTGDNSGTGAKKKAVPSAGTSSGKPGSRSTVRRDEPSPRRGARAKPRTGGRRSSRSRSRSRSRGKDKRKASSSTSSSESSSSSSASSTRSSSSGSSSSSSSEDEGAKRRPSSSSASPLKRRIASKNVPSKGKRLPSATSAARRGGGIAPRNVRTSPAERKRTGGKGGDTRAGPPRTPPGKTSGFGGNKIDKDDFRPKSFVSRADTRKRPRSRSASYSPDGKYARSYGSDDDDDEDKDRDRTRGKSPDPRRRTALPSRASKLERGKGSPDRSVHPRREGRGSHTPPPSIASSASVVALSASKRRSVSKESSRSPSSIRGRRGRSGSARRRSSRSPLGPASGLKSVVGAIDPKKKKVDPKRTVGDKKGSDRKAGVGGGNAGRNRDRDKDKGLSRTGGGGKRSAILEMDRERRNSRSKATRTTGSNRRRRSRSSSRESSRSRGRVDRSGGGGGSTARRRRKDDDDALVGSKAGPSSRAAKKRAGRRRQGLSIGVRSPPPLPPLSHLDYHRTRPDVDEFLRPLIGPWDPDDRAGRWPVHPLPFADFPPYPDEALHRRNRRSESDAGNSSFASLRMRGDHRLVGLPPPPPPHHVHPLSGRGHLSSWPDASTPWDRDGRGGRRDRDRDRLLRRRAKHVGDWRDDAKGQRFGGRPRSPGSPLLPPQDDGSPSRLHASRGVRYPDGPYGSELPGDEGRLDAEGEAGLRHGGKRGSGRRSSFDNEGAAGEGEGRSRRDAASREKDAARGEEDGEARPGSTQPEADCPGEEDAAAEEGAADEERASNAEDSDNEGGGGMGLGEEEEEWKIIDFEEISDEELTANEEEQEDSEAKRKPSIADILDVDWSELLAESSKRPEGAVKTEAESGAGYSAKRRLAPGRLFAEIGVSSKFAGPAIVEEIKSACREAMEEDGLVKPETDVKKEEGEEETKPEKNAFEFLSPIASFHTIHLRMKRKRERLFSDFSSYCRGFTARKDLRLRNFLSSFIEPNNNNVVVERKDDDVFSLEGCRLDAFEEAVEMYRARNT